MKKHNIIKLMKTSNVLIWSSCICPVIATGFLAIEAFSWYWVNSHKYLIWSLFTIPLIYTTMIAAIFIMMVASVKGALLTGNKPARNIFINIIIPAFTMFVAIWVGTKTHKPGFCWEISFLFIVLIGSPITSYAVMSHIVAHRTTRNIALISAAISFSGAVLSAVIQSLLK